MTHRDELLALRTRVEAMERDIDEARSENELLRAAHAQKTREAETLKRRLEALHGGGDDGGGADGPPLRPGPPRRQPPELQFGRAMRFAAIALGMTMLGTMMLSTVMSARARSHRARMQYGPAPTSQVTPLVRTGTVVETSGPELLEVGDRCTVERIPVAAGPFDCRVEVRCGDQTLYGADPRTGYVRCAGQEVVRDGNTTRFDGDPAMTLDLAHDTVTVEERVGLGTQRIRIQL